MLRDTLLTGDDLDVFSHLQVTLPQEDEIYLSLRIAGLIGDEMAITFGKESVSNDKLISNREVKDSFTICITIAKPRTAMDTFVS